MTAKEFSDQFDVLWNNIASNEAPGLNEYEKSVFLTKAQDEIIKNYFNSAGNKYQQGFDENAKRQIDFSSILKNTNIVTPKEVSLTYDPRSIAYDLPDDLFLYVNEQVLLQKSEESGGSVSLKTVGIRQVVPIKFDEYSLLMSKPFKEPLKYQCWRLISGNSSDTFVEIILTSKDKKEYTKDNKVKVVYNIRYIKRPQPILLADFSDSFGEDITINGMNGSESGYDLNNPCELDPILHEEILQRAVELAQVALGNDQLRNAELKIQAGQRSE